MAEILIFELNLGKLKIDKVIVGLVCLLFFIFMCICSI